MIKLTAPNVPDLLRSDQYLEFQLINSNAGNKPLRYIIGIYDESLEEFVLSEDFTVTPKGGKIKSGIRFSDISILDAGKYTAYLLKHEDNLPYDPTNKAIGDVRNNNKIEFIKEGSTEINMPFEITGIKSTPTIVRLDSTKIDDTDDKELWKSILNIDIDFNKFKEVMDQVLFFTDRNVSDKSQQDNTVNREMRNRLPFSGVEEYSMLKFVTNAYMRRTLHINSAKEYFGNDQRLPYYDAVMDGVEEIMDSIVAEKTKVNEPNAFNYTERRINSFPAIELLWSYWMEQGMLVQTMNAVSLRFQNVKGIREVEPLGRFDTSPLRALSHILWGYIQDEQHTVPLSRRVNEYDHEYGLKLLGRAVPEMRPVDTRSKFLEAFHNLLAKCAIFYKEIDDTTRKPDGFPIYTSLKEVHLLLAEGNHNAYQNLTWTVRQEMMVQQYILARQEMREFLGGRPMMPYQEKWMDKVDTMKMLQGWDSTSIIHYYDLAYCGEKLLLGVRYGNWNNVGIGATEASNWAVAFRNLAQKYIHGYQTVAGVDLSADAAVGASSDSRATQPSLLIAGRSSAAKQTVEIRQRAALGRY